MAFVETEFGKFFYYVQDCIGREVASGKFVDGWLRPQMDRLGQGSVLIDVGASLGFYTIYAAKKGAMVYAFEPSMEVFDLLKRNCEINGVMENVVLHNTSLYDSEQELWLETRLNRYPILEDGRIDYEQASNSAVLCLVPKEKGTEPCESYKTICRTRTLDSFGLDADLLKIDTQGCDMRVLQGAKVTIIKSRPIICFEHEPELLGYHGDSFQSFLEFFAELNYQEPVHLGGVDYVAVPE